MTKVTDNKISDAEIINCLNDTVGKEHIGIYCTDKNGNFTAVVKLIDLVDFLNRQKAEIERLKRELISADEVIGFREAEIERLQKEVSKLKHEMSYMKSPNTIGDRNEMGCW